MKGRAVNRRAVEERFGLEHDDSPLLCVVSRLTWQKGMDILAAVRRRARRHPAPSSRCSAPATMRSKARCLPARPAIPAASAWSSAMTRRLSHTMQGGCDAILIPSRFEPCGLTQLYGLRYGCVPVVARTGGLADTVIDANEAALAAGVATGFQFAAANADAFMQAIRRVVALHADKPAWLSLQKQGMKADVSWARSAQRYAELYKTLIARKQALA